MAEASPVQGVLLLSNATWQSAQSVDTNFHYQADMAMLTRVSEKIQLRYRR